MEVKSYKKIIDETVTYFPQHKPPYKSLIFKWVIKYRSYGTLENLNSKTPDHQGHSGRKIIRDEAL